MFKQRAEAAEAENTALKRRLEGTEDMLSASRSHVERLEYELRGLQSRCAEAMNEMRSLLDQSQDEADRAKQEYLLKIIDVSLHTELFIG